MKKKIFRTGVIIALIGISSLTIGYTLSNGFSALRAVFDLILLFSGMYLVRLSNAMK